MGGPQSDKAFQAEFVERQNETLHLRAVLLAVRGPYCWCRYKYPDGQGKIHHTNACKEAQKLTGVEYGEDR